jgi:hypothetical protein
MISEDTVISVSEHNILNGGITASLLAPHQMGGDRLAGSGQFILFMEKCPVPIP